MTYDVIAQAKVLYEHAVSPQISPSLASAAWKLLGDHGQKEWIEAASKANPDKSPAPVPFPTHASDILSQAISIVSGNRQTVNGAPERSLEMLAAMWSAYLGVDVTATDAGLMLAQLKMVRAKTGVTKDDHFVDGAGYFALAGEVSSRGREG